MLHLYYISPPERDRWLPGDRFIRPLIRHMLRGKPRAGGVDKVFYNLVEGLKRIGHPFTVNQPLADRRSGDRIVLLGRGLTALKGFEKGPPFIAGIGLFTHPAEVPDFNKKYPVLAYLSHSDWVNRLCQSYLGDICRIWPAGVDTKLFNPIPDKTIEYDFILYDKLNFNREEEEVRVLAPIRNKLQEKGLTYFHIRYGNYQPETYRNLLKNSRFLLFLSPHESQGLACQEAMASGLPVLAMDEGIVRDPYYIQLGSRSLPVSSVPWFNSTCGLTFRNADDFPEKLALFLQQAEQGQYHPADYIREEFSLEASAHKLLDLVERVYSSAGHPLSK